MTAPDVFVHPAGLCESDRVGPGTRVWAFAHVMAGATIGAGCNLGDHCFVESGAVIGARVTIKNGVAIWDRVTIGDDVFVGPFATFTNDPTPRAAFKKVAGEFEPTLIEDGATIGANATIVCGIVVGQAAFVGAGATVVRDVPAHALVVGNPASRIDWVCTCGERLPDDLVCPACARRFRHRERRPGGLTAVVEDR